MVLYFLCFHFYSQDNTLRKNCSHLSCWMRLQKGRWSDWLNSRPPRSYGTGSWLQTVSLVGRTCFAQSSSFWAQEMKILPIQDPILPKKDPVCFLTAGLLTWEGWLAERSSEKCSKGGPWKFPISWTQELEGQAEKTLPTRLTTCGEQVQRNGEKSKGNPEDLN
jgi:hypothetical protein